MVTVSEAAQIETNRLLCFYSLYLHTANGAARHICPLHYLHLRFIRAVLTCVPLIDGTASLHTGPVAKVGQGLGSLKNENRVNIMMSFYCLCLDVFNRKD